VSELQPDGSLEKLSLRKAGSIEPDNPAAEPDFVLSRDIGGQHRSAREKLKDHGIRAEVDDARSNGIAINITFPAELREYQERAFHSSSHASGPGSN
jgi:hypothetical protein